MSEWSSTKAKRVLAALLRIGWEIKRQSGSHKILIRPDWADFVFAFHDGQDLLSPNPNLNPGRKQKSDRVAFL